MKRIIKPMDIIIRNITDKDHYEIELVAKRAFWNLNMPGCDEHYLVHRLWNEPCYIPELSLAAEVDNKNVGAILYSKAKIETDHGSKEVLTFGPLCVDPDYQKMGIGKKLLLESMRIATENGHQAILICGVQTYYPKFGFKTADTFGITMPDGSNFDAFMGYELQKGALKGVTGKFYESDFFDCDVHDEEYKKAVDEYDKNFANEFFDIVVTIDSFHYFANQKGFFETKILPLVKKGGKVIIAMPGLKEEIHGKEPEVILEWLDGEESEYSLYHCRDWWLKQIGQSDDFKVLMVFDLESFDEAWQDWFLSRHELALHDEEFFKKGIGKYLSTVGLVIQKV